MTGKEYNRIAREKSNMFSMVRPLGTLFAVPKMVLVLTIFAMCASQNDKAKVMSDRRTSACFGNYKNFLTINCPRDTRVEITGMRNGAKPTAISCPAVTTGDKDFRQNCCSYSEGDCVVNTHPNNYPSECIGVHFCSPQATMASTQPFCYRLLFPEYTHYTEITYHCVAPAQNVTGRISKSILPDLATSTADSTTPTNTTTPTPPPPNNTTAPSQGHQTIPIAANKEDFTPAMIGGTAAGLVGLFLTIFIFIFYWGRKRKVRMTGKTQNNVWDFLLSSTMSVRNIRSYDNFSSGTLQSLSPSSDKNVWLPNISLAGNHTYHSHHNHHSHHSHHSRNNHRSQRRDSVSTADENSSVFTEDPMPGSSGINTGLSLGVAGQTKPELKAINRL